jgi:hypothetical protein
VYSAFLIGQSSLLLASRQQLLLRFIYTGVFYSIVVSQNARGSTASCTCFSRFSDKITYFIGCTYQGTKVKYSCCRCYWHFFTKESALNSASVNTALVNIFLIDGCGQK